MAPALKAETSFGRIFGLWTRNSGGFLVFCLIVLVGFPLLRDLRTPAMVVGTRTDQCRLSIAQTSGTVCVRNDVWNSILAVDRRLWSQITQDARQVEGQIVRNGYNRSYGNDNLWDRKRNDYVLSVWRPTMSCPHESRVEGGGDGGKWACGIEALARKAREGGGCLVYSPGSNNKFDFEADLLERLDNNCEVHVFDHTVREWRTPKSTKIITHSFAVTSEALEVRGSQFKSYQTIRRILGHQNRFIDIFKIDIEGGGYDVLPEVFRDTNPVEQILVEVHMTSATRQRIGVTDDLLYHSRKPPRHLTRIGHSSRLIFQPPG
jgi:Methyltransferase domain